MNKELKVLTQKRDDLTKKAEDLQVKSADHRFEIALDNRSDIKTISEHLNKGFTWKTQNAAIIVTLHDQLKKQAKELAASNTDETVIKLRGHELNGLYQSLLNVEGNGIENARRFIKMLTNVGEAVTDAMKELSVMNQEINDIHAELSELDQQIENLESNQTNEVEPVLETENETSN